MHLGQTFFSDQSYHALRASVWKLHMFEDRNVKIRSTTAAPISKVWMAPFANRDVASIGWCGWESAISPLVTPIPLRSSYPVSPLTLIIRHSETMVSQILLLFLLSTCFSRVANTAAPPVNLALDQPLQPLDTG